MKIQQSLVERIESHIRKLQNEKDLSQFKFRVSKSNTTNSVYIQASTKVDTIIIRRSFRISDHRNSKIPTKIVCKSTNFTLIKRRIEGLIKQLEEKRLKMSFDVIQSKQNS